MTRLHVLIEAVCRSEARPCGTTWPLCVATSIDYVAMLRYFLLSYRAG
jgi:hypothetical protein